MKTMNIELINENNRLREQLGLRPRITGNYKEYRNRNTSKLNPKPKDKAQPLTLLV